MTAARQENAGELALGRLLSDAHLAPPDRLPEVVAAAAEDLGATDTLLLVVDHAQTRLVPVEGGEALSVDGTMAGRAFRQIQPQIVEAEGGRRVWLPLLDGLERLGVLGLTFPAIDEDLLPRCRRFASLTAELVVSRSLIGDTLQRAAR